jgi:hypothetical protein
MMVLRSLLLLLLLTGCRAGQTAFSFRPVALAAAGPAAAAAHSIIATPAQAVPANSTALNHRTLRTHRASHFASLHRVARAPRPVKIQPPERAQRRLSRQGTLPVPAKKSQTNASIGFFDGGLTLGIGGVLLGIGGVLFGGWLGGAVGVATIALAVGLGIVLMLFGLTAFAFNDTGQKAQFNIVTLLGALLATGGLAAVLGVALPVMVPGLGLLILAAGLVVAGFGMLG